MRFFTKTLPCLALLSLLLLAALARCWNHADVFVEGKTFFSDGDCYSRMTRVRQVLEHPGTIVRHHDFENWPQGTDPHTTAPFDDLTAALALALRHLSAHPLDLAGALVSPLLGVLTALFLWIWIGRLKLPYRFPTIFLFATSPILVHGTVLGRPDHQSLLMLCMAVALGADALLMRERSVAWEIASGLAWGLGLWVSLYEPSVLFVAAGVLRLCLWRRGQKERGLSSPRSLGGQESPLSVTRPLPSRWIALLGVLLLATFTDGWHSIVPAPEVVKLFPNWSQPMSVGELGHASFPLLLRWTCALLPLSAVLLALAARDRRALFWLALVALTAGLTLWELRWGYFFGLFFAMSLPWQLASLERLLSRLFRGGENGKWPARAAVAIFAVSLWPMAGEWNQWLFPSEAEAARRGEVRNDNAALFDVAMRLRGPRLLPVLAPWWLSPAIAYWSRQPCLAGSSHESLPGTADTARFYLSEDPVAARAILERRKAAVVVAYDPDRVIGTSSIILEGKARSAELGGESEKAMGAILYRRPHSAPAFLKLAYANGAFRVFVSLESLQGGK